MTIHIKKPGPHQPVNCVVSDWSPWVAINATTEQRTRTILTPAANGGIACPTPDQLVETRPLMVSRGLIAPASLVYLGAFRVPLVSSSDFHDFAGGGRALAFNPAHDSLFLTGEDGMNPSRVGEITIPAPKRDCALADLNRAECLQAPNVDILAGTMDRIGAGVSGIVGLLVDGGDLYATCVINYDAGYAQHASHFRTIGLDFARPHPVIGPVVLGDGGRWMAGYMANLPPVWQSVLGGTALGGQALNSIITASENAGPGFSAFTPSQIGVVPEPLPAPTLARYPPDHMLVTSLASHVAGLACVPAYRSVLAFGFEGYGDHVGYGTPTLDRALDGQLTDPANPNGDVYCYDPEFAGFFAKGPHDYSLDPAHPGYRTVVWAFDINTLRRVREGAISPIGLSPYARWSLDDLLQFLPPPGDNSYRHYVIGAACDPATGRIFLAASGDSGPGYLPLIQVLQVV